MARLSAVKDKLNLSFTILYILYRFPETHLCRMENTSTGQPAAAVSEAKIQSACFLWHWNTYPAERKRLFMIYNNPKNAAHGAVLKSMGMIAGVSDMQYLSPSGKVWFLECKKPGEHPSPAQREFAELITSLGHQYRVFRSLPEFQAILDEARFLLA